MLPSPGSATSVVFTTSNNHQATIIVLFHVNYQFITMVGSRCEQCELSFDDQRELFNYANEIGLVAFSTPFDEESVDFLAEIETPLLKVASFDIVNKTFIFN